MAPDAPDMPDATEGEAFASKETPVGIEDMIEKTKLESATKTFVSSDGRRENDEEERRGKDNLSLLTRLSKRHEIATKALSSHCEIAGSTLR